MIRIQNFISIGIVKVFGGWSDSFVTFNIFLDKGLVVRNFIWFLFYISITSFVSPYIVSYKRKNKYKEVNEFVEVMVFYLPIKTIHLRTRCSWNSFIKDNLVTPVRNYQRFIDNYVGTSWDFGGIFRLYGGVVFHNIIVWKT